MQVNFNLDPQIILTIILFLLWIYLLSKILRKLLRFFLRLFGGKDSLWSNIEEEYKQLTDQSEEQIQEKAQQLRELTIISDPLSEAILAGGSRDPTNLSRLARKTSRDQLKAMSIARTEDRIELSLQSGTTRLESEFPTNDMEPDHIRGPHEITEVFPETFTLDETTFAYGTIMGTHQRMRSYDNVSTTRRGYIIRDVSPSMNSQMQDGTPRYIWAAGVVIAQLNNAAEGQSEFYIRNFSASPGELQKVLTREQAIHKIQHLLNNKPSGSGTNIFRAFSKAVDDINNSTDVDTNEVLLISDGEDKSMNNTSRVKDMLGNNIRLHVIMIGAENAALQDVATTYQVVH